MATREYLLILILPWIAATALAQPDFDRSYFGDRERGWFWYEAPPQVPKKENNIKSRPATTADPQAKLKAFQKKLEDARALAVMEPTEKNIKRYIEIQTVAMEQSSVFADQWRRVIWANPQLDNTVKNPVSAVGNWVNKDIRRDAQADAVRALGRTEGLFFFYKSSCPYCVSQAPILARFALTYGLRVMAISLDGSMLPEFPNAKMDNGLAAKLGVNATPATFMVNPSTQSITPLVYGMASESELLDRVYALTRSKIGQF